MSISLEQVFLIISASATATTAIFWGAFLLGRLQNRIEFAEKGITALDGRMDRAGNKMSDLTDTVQKMPDEFERRFVPRHELGTLLQINGRRRMDES